MSSRTRSVLFALSGLLVLAGAVLYLTHAVFAPYLFAVGAAGVAVSFLTLSTAGMDFRERRLHRYNLLSGLLMILSSGLMFSGRKEWVICLFIAALFLLYTSFAWPKRD